MAPDEPSAPRRRRRSSPVADSYGLPPGVSLAEAIALERSELMQIHAMVCCLNDVLLYADDDDSPMHADVAHVVARLLDDSVARLEQVRMRVAQLEKAAEERAKNSPPCQIAEKRATYTVDVRNSTTSAAATCSRGTLHEHARLLECCA